MVNNVYSIMKQGEESLILTNAVGLTSIEGSFFVVDADIDVDIQSFMSRFTLRYLRFCRAMSVRSCSTRM